MNVSFQYVSDLHLEFPANRRHLEANPLIPMAPVLILAGDIMLLNHYKDHLDFINWCSDHFESVWWVPGNHEFYRDDISNYGHSFRYDLRPNVHLLHNQGAEIQGVQFLFSSLWSRIPADKKQIISSRMSDFHLIRNQGNKFTVADYNEYHDHSLQFLNASLSGSTEGKPSVIVSHHVPSFINYPPEYAFSDLNMAFASNQEHLMRHPALKAWIYGHHHRFVPEFEIGNCRLLTNQLGYVDALEHHSFRPDQVLILD